MRATGARTEQIQRLYIYYSHVSVGVWLLPIPALEIASEFLTLTITMA